MEFRDIFVTAIVCLLVHVEFGESNTRKDRNIYSALCRTSLLTTSGCLLKIQSCSAGATTCKVKVRGTLTTDPATRFTIVTVTAQDGTVGKCIEFTTASQVKYALKVDNTTNIIFEKQHNGCDNGIPDDFIFKEARKIPRHFTYTHNAKCLGTNIDGALSLMNINDKRCRYRLFKWT
ncbi:uncharacterized protein LOC113664161 isoform X2 [Pocillopora damicornis]|uniref:uncharacterized protein LOC113664161 isoform X2 n=1 Tax=Pocillopora damicornis TaxID=46731 RepID=UPI000F54D764|nr:uncharacterized protein LOC113664161 isoform X2 [Pocillopora damicornis]